jgi:exopolysaccharide biosynthesis protein
MASLVFLILIFSFYLLLFITFYLLITLTIYYLLFTFYFLPMKTGPFSTYENQSDSQIWCPMRTAKQVFMAVLAADCHWPVLNQN